ncbi:MAG: hypothetical protein RDV48_17370 [Candidatus Eremiobacteraeota bacterium]|nr:hypothetical protein [Candidatus Eremiobacteraeota bacterium]
MAKLQYHCPSCGSRLKLESRVPAAPQSVMGTLRCGECNSISYLYATRCPHCGEINFGMTTIHIASTQLQMMCSTCRNAFYWVTP